jgi:hypothetical protein
VLAGVTDYGIPVNKATQDGRAARSDLAILQNAAKTRAIPAFDTVAPRRRSSTTAQKKSNEELTLEQRAAMRLYDCGHGVEADLVDDTFYRTLVMAWGLSTTST